MMEFWNRERNRERKASGKTENSTDISGKWNVPSFFVDNTLSNESYENFL